MPTRRTIGKNPLDLVPVEGNPLDFLLGAPVPAQESSGTGTVSKSGSAPPSSPTPGGGEPVAARDQVRRGGASSSRAHRAPYVTFRLADGIFAVDVRKVREIVPFTRVTRVPRAAPWIRGVVNIRGSVVPVIDVARKLAAKGMECRDPTCILVVEIVLGEETSSVGVLVDSVDQVIELAPGRLPGSRGSALRSLEYLSALGRIGDTVVLILDVERALADQELESLTSVPSGCAEERSA